MDLFVDLPASRKGSDLSRNAEVIEEIVEKSARKLSPSLESFCSRTAKTLLEKHEYATYSEVHAKADYFLDRLSPTGRSTREPYVLRAKATANRKEGPREYIGVEVVGMTVCPCAMETVRKTTGKHQYVTHNQRNISNLMIEAKEGVDADDLIDIAEKSMSSPTYEILKRLDEKEVVVRAHENPKFVEDVVRDMLKNVLKKYGHLPDDTCVIAMSESMESIHKHNAFAERHTTLGELKK
jgi:GTP cyclohydrolase-4